MEKLENSREPTQSRRSFLKTSASVLGGLALSQPSLETLAAKEHPSGRKPNILVFLGEGLRYDELSCMGHPVVQTPNMDRVAREGMSFRNAFVTNALCLPSRASMLTGMYSHSVNAVGNEPTTQMATALSHTIFRWFPTYCMKRDTKPDFLARHISKEGCKTGIGIITSVLTDAPIITIRSSQKALRASIPGPGRLKVTWMT